MGSVSNRGRRWVLADRSTGEHSAAFPTRTAAARLVSRMSSEASELSDAEQGAISAEESLSCVPCPRYQNNRGAHLHRSTSSNSGSVLQRESVSAVKDSEVPSAVDAGFATAGAPPHQQRLARCRGKVRVNRAWHDAVRACAAHMPGRAARSASVLFLFIVGPDLRLIRSAANVLEPPEPPRL